jgi:hypothetical protein
MRAIGYVQNAKKAAAGPGEVVAVAMEAARQLSPRRGGIVHMDELPVAISRSAAFAMIRSLGSHLIRPEPRVRLEEWHRGIPDYEFGPGGSDRAEWPAGLTGIGSLPLVFPPGGGPA